MTTTILHVGPVKAPYLADGLREYEKRLGAGGVANILIPEERVPETPSPAEIESALRKEGAAILRAIPARAYSIALCVEGAQMSSEELAALYAKLPHEGYAGVAFIIGSSHGLAPEVKNAAKLRLSFSKMTFPHQMMRLMLLEQVYRAASINHGTKYHK